MWPAVMDALAGYSRVAWMAFSGSHPLSWSDAVLAVGMDSQGKVTNVANGGHDEGLRNAIKDVLKVTVRVDVVLAPNSAPKSTTAAAPITAEGDAPSPDDDNIDDVSGVDLIVRELGATQIGEIEH